MELAGYMVSAVGVLLFVIGCGYWIWFCSGRNYVRAVRRKSPWDFLGNLTVVGLLVFAAGRALAAIASRVGP